MWSSWIVDPGLLTSLMTSSRNNHYRNFGAKYGISETKPDSGMGPMDSLYKLAYGLSIAHAPDDVT